MIKIQFREVMENIDENNRPYFDLQLLPQIGLVVWKKTKTQNSIRGIYFTWIFWSLLFYVETK